MIADRYAGATRDEDLGLGLDEPTTRRFTRPTDRGDVDAARAKVQASLDAAAERAARWFDDHRAANPDDRSSPVYEAARDLAFAAKDRADEFARETDENAPVDGQVDEGSNTNNHMEVEDDVETDSTRGDVRRDVVRDPAGDDVRVHSAGVGGMTTYAAGYDCAERELASLAETDAGRMAAARLLLDRLQFGDSRFDEGYRECLTYAAAEDPVEHFGYCASWCCSRHENKGGGASVDEHGDWCASGSFEVRGIDALGLTVPAYVSATRRYVHGTVDSAENRLANQFHGGVGITLAEEFDPTLYLSPAVARELAAGLIHAANLVDRITRVDLANES